MTLAVSVPLIFLGLTLACLVYWSTQRLPLERIVELVGEPEPEPAKPRNRSLLYPLERWLERKLAMAQLHLPARYLLNAMLAAAALGALLARPFGSGLLIGVSALVFGAAPYRFVHARMRARNRAIQRAVESALVQIAKLCEVRNHPFLALADAVSLLEPPLQTELAEALADAQAGLPLEEALRRMAVRCCDNFYLHQLAELVALNVRTGGDLAASLDRLAARLRAVEELRAEEAAEMYGYAWLTRILLAAALLPLPYWALTGSESLQLFMTEPLARGLLVWVVLSGLAIATLPYWLAIEE